MWDSDFEEFHVPEHIAKSSDTVRQEGQAATELAQIVEQLKTVLKARGATDSPEEAEVNAVALVHASLSDNNDEFYQSLAWQNCKDRVFHVEGGSFGDVLACAKQYLLELSRV